MALDPTEFSVRVTGETSGEEFVGKFKARKVLNHAQQLEVDRIRRDLLGSSSNPDAASPRAANAAMIFAELAVRLVDAPNWWKESGNGTDLYDDNVVASVYQEAMKAQNDHLKAVKARAEAAKKDLEKLNPA